jgi:hypothetical protein
MDLKMNTKSFNVMTDDKVIYTKNEINRLNAEGLEITPQIHRIKKDFGGDICQIIQGLESEKLPKHIAKDLEPKQLDGCQKSPQIGIQPKSGQDLLF